MKIKNNSLLRLIPAAAIAVTGIAISSSAHAQTWDGGGATISWGTKENWEGDTLPAFNTSTDLIFNTTAKPDLNIGAARTIRSITFGADIDSNFVTNFRTYDGGASAALTMQAASGNATLTVDAGATGNISYGWIGTGTAGGNLILSSDLDIVHNGSGNLTLSRQITGTSGFTKSGSGTMIVAQFNTNSFTGAANFNGGRAIFGNTNTAGGDLNTASAVNFGGGILEIRTTNALNKTLTSNTTVSSTSTLAYNNTTANTQSLTISTGTMALDADLTVQNISATTTLNNQIIINRNITGAGDLIVETYNNVTSSTPAADFALGRVALGGNNTGWSGDMIIREGTAQIFGDTALGQFSAGTGDIILGETANAFGAGLLLAASTPTAGAKTLANDIIVRSGGFRTLRGGSDHTYNMNGSILLEGDLNVHNGLFYTDKNMILNGDITGVGGLSITESGNPNFTRLTGNNTYTGGTSIGAGAVLNILSASGNAIGDTSAVTFAGVGATLAFNATNETVGSIASSGTDGAINLGANILTTGGDNTSTSYGGTISGTGGSLTKVGSGTMTLNGTNSYTGTTTVSAGTLVLGSSATLSSVAVLVETGATLNTADLIGGLTIASAARIGGDGIVIGDISLASGAQFVFTIGSTLDVIGAVSLDNTFSVASLVTSSGGVIDWSSVANGTYTLINNGSDFSNIDNFGLANKADLGGGKEAYFQNGSLQLVVVPEPSTALLLVGSLGAFALLRRRGGVKRPAARR